MLARTRPFLRNGLVVLGLSVVTPWVVAACGGDDDNNSPGPSAGGSGGGAGSSNGGDDSGGSSSGGKASGGSAGKGSGGSAQAGDTGVGGEGGEPPSTTTPGSQYGFVAAGERSTSANFVFIGSLGEGPGGSTRMTSASYLCEGGLLGTQ